MDFWHLLHFSKSVNSNLNGQTIEWKVHAERTNDRVESSCWTNKRSSGKFMLNEQAIEWQVHAERTSDRVVSSCWTNKRSSGKFMLNEQAIEWQIHATKKRPIDTRETQSIRATRIARNRHTIELDMLIEIKVILNKRNKLEKFSGDRCKFKTFKSRTLITSTLATAFSSASPSDNMHYY
jgi:hypothetical protein